MTGRGRAPRVRGRPNGGRPLRLPAAEWLEDRPLLAVSLLGSAAPLQFLAFNDAQVSHFLSAPGEVDLYSVTLGRGDTLSLGINAQQSGSGLASTLRVFTANGTPLALDDQQGGDPHLVFQAATSGKYVIGVSSAPNNHYNPNIAGSGTAGGTTGLYTLTARLTSAAPLQPDMTGSSFRTGVNTAAPGDQVPLRFTVQNRGGADPGNLQVQVLLAGSNQFDDSSTVLATLTRSQLIRDATGRSFSAPAGLSVSIPAGWAPGPAFIGVRIIPDPAVDDSGTGDKSGVHRGTDWEPLTIAASVPLGTTDLSLVDPGLRTESSGSLAPNQVVAWSFTVSDDLGAGEFKAQVAATGSLTPRLTLIGATGGVLVQSDSGLINQSLLPGTYLMTVSAQDHGGAFRLTTVFVKTSLPYVPLASGTGTAWVTTGDVNNDGIADIVTGNRIDNTASVFLGNGDGTFAKPQSFAIGARVWRVSVADVNGDGKPDILTANKGENTVGVLLGSGDGTFQAMTAYPVDTRPGGVTAADVNGDGAADLVVSNYASDTVGILLGTGDGTFLPQQTYPTENGSGFAGPGPVAVADVNGDGIPDLVYPNYIGANVAVRLGAGNGAFGPQQTFPAGKGSYSVRVFDVNGDGLPDVVDANAVDNTVSVLLGNGNGTFKPQKVYQVGFDPYSMTVSDVNGDGAPDIVTANRGDNTVSVLLGKGGGKFQPQRIFPTGKFPRSVAVADLNADGVPDIVTANQGDDSVSVLLGNGDGTFSFGAQQSAPAPKLRPFQVVVADVNDDGIPDIVSANRSDNSVSVLLGNRDGSFQTKETFAAGRLPISAAVADINGDGKPDIITANYGGNTVSVLLGNGDGTFQPHQDIVAGSDPYNVKVADINGDGELDLAVTNKNDNTAGILLGNGDGSFQPMKAFPVASGPYEIVVEDLDGNKIPDLVVSHFSASVVDVLLGNGDGTFQPSRTFPIGARPYGLAVADVNGDGKPDIVTSNYHDGTVSVLLGIGDGSFQSGVNYRVGKAPNEVQVADLNGDGKLDIVTSNYGSDSVSVLLGNSTGGFQPERTFAAGSGPASVWVADLNGDRKLDLVVGNRNASTVSVLLGRGDGTFPASIPFGAGKNRYAVAVADVNGDGYLDVVSTNVSQDTVTVKLGNGDGSFGPGQSLPVGPGPTSVVVADLNGDGRPDLVTTNSDGNSVSVVLGNGDGTFSVQQTFAVGRSPRSARVADVNGDGIRDIVVANYNDNTVGVLLGVGDGTFLSEEVFAVGAKPYALAIADINGDGRRDIVAANSASDTVSVLLGDGRGEFSAPRTFDTGRQPFAVAVADMNGDGVPDIVTADAFDNSVSVLFGNRDGSFQTRRAFAVASRPYALALSDVNGDGLPDIVTTNYGSNNVSVLLNKGGGSFQAQRTFATDESPVKGVVADVNDDGRPDLIVVSNQDSATGVLLGKGDGTFQSMAAASGVGVTNTPFLADLNGDGVLDSIVLDRSGNILFRKGLVEASDTFAPPVILNPGRPARDITVIHLGTQYAIAAADARYDPTLSVNQFIFTVSIYTVSDGGAVSRRIAFSTTALPTSLAAAYLGSNGLEALVAANALDNSVSIALQTSPGAFAAPTVVSVGIAPAAITVADMNRDGLADVIVSDQTSGDVTVLLNDRAHSFAETLRFRADGGLYGLSAVASVPSVNSFAESVSIVSGDFTGDGQNDLLVVNQATHSFTILAGNGRGGVANPRRVLTTSTSEGLSINQRPGAIVAGDFNRDGHLDLAVLMEDTGVLWIYSGSGGGAFRHTFSIPVGDQATGLAVVPDASTGLLNLLVGNGFGDVLALEGKGDGTFQIQGSRVSLSVVPNLLGPGQAGVLVGNQQNNSVTVQAPSANGAQYTPVQTLNGTTTSQQMAPGDVEWSVLDRGATLPDAVVVSTGSNAVVVYRTTGITNGVPTFAATPQTIFVGTAPAGLTVADINADGVPDMLVPNRGSNDVSVVFGSYDADGHWVGLPGPRLKSGGDGPIAVAVRDMNSDHVPDLAVTNGGSGTVTLLPGVGRGFFDDRQSQTRFDLGSAIVQPPTFAGSSGVGFAVMATGNLVRFSLDDPAEGATVAFAGQSVVAAQALSDGKVVVAVADGSVKILVPDGDSLRVSTTLEAKGQTPSAPSAIQVVSQSSGQINVLVSSQGSDTISVFAQGSTPSTSGSGTGAQGGNSSTGGGQSVATAPGIAVSLTTGTNSSSTALTSSSASQTSVTASLSNSANTSTLSGNASFTIGMSLGNFSSGTESASRTTTGAVLSAVEGNTYFSVPVLEFGGEGDEVGAGEARMPWLATMHAIGDTSPLTRFVIGLDEAARAYSGTTQEPGVESPGRAGDPWNEDLFFQHLPVPPSTGGDANGDPMGANTHENGWPSAPERVRNLAEITRTQLIDRCMDDPPVCASSPAARVAAHLEALAGTLAAALFTPAIAGLIRVGPQAINARVRIGADRKPHSHAPNAPGGGRR